MLDPHSPVGKSQLVILHDVTAIMLAAVMPALLLTIGSTWWFRAGKKRARYLSNREHSGPAEMIVWSIPLLGILFVGGGAWRGSHDFESPMPPIESKTPFEIDVVSLDWPFIYPAKGVAGCNLLMVPGRNYDPLQSDLCERHKLVPRILRCRRGHCAYLPNLVDRYHRPVRIGRCRPHSGVA